MVIAHIVSAAAKWRVKKKVGEDDSGEEEESSECISRYSIALQCVGTLLDTWVRIGSNTVTL
jgi:hypothetical protein